jgi:Holliday junction resolvase RusA-like endonuclease
MRQAAETIPPAPFMFEGNLNVTLEFVCHHPPSTKRLNPRGDIDNHIKSILDALTKKRYWNDDDQITFITALKRWPEGQEAPHTRVRIENE